MCVCCITHSDCSCNRRRFPSSGVPSVVQNLRLRREIHPINLFFPPFNEFRHLVPFPILGRFFRGGARNSSASPNQLGPIDGDFNEQENISAVAIFWER